MANVRLDANGLAKGFVYEGTAPLAHRAGVTEVDAADPADTSGAIDTTGYGWCRLDLNVTGAGFQALTVQVLYWNPRQGTWFGGASRRLDATGKYALLVDARGATVFLKVVSFSGTSFTLSADYSLS